MLPPLTIVRLARTSTASAEISRLSYLRLGVLDSAAFHYEMGYSELWNTNSLYEAMKDDISKENAYENMKTVRKHYAWMTDGSLLLL